MPTVFDFTMVTAGFPIIGLFKRVAIVGLSLEAKNSGSENKLSGNFYRRANYFSAFFFKNAALHAH
jgi:hypothetical protein